MTIGIKEKIVMEESNNNRVTQEVLKKVMELDKQLHQLKEERDNMFYRPARMEIIEQMRKHGVNELLLLEKDEATGEWKRFKDAFLFFNEDYDPIFSYEGEDTCYRIVRFGIIEDKLRMRLQEIPDGPDGELLQKPEGSEWIPFWGFADFELLFLLLCYVNHGLDPYNYTKAHPELLVLGK